MMQTKLDLITDICKRDPECKINNIDHLLNIENLNECFYLLKKNKASGKDGVTYEEYEPKFDVNISNLVPRMKAQTYKPQSVKRVHIPKADGQLRHLGIPAHEDKIVQKSMVWILKSINETEFMNFTYGLRPNRSCHQVLKEWSSTLNKKTIHHFINADIKGIFDNVDHDWMIKFMEHRISYPDVNRLIKRFLRNGYMEEGITRVTEIGTPQGVIISPILANINLYYALDLWVEKKVKNEYEGKVIIVRCADEFVIGFQKIDEVKKLLASLKDRVKKFNLELSKSKTNLIEFGRFTKVNSSNRKVSQSTFNFLGFKHFMTRSVKGNFKVGRKTEKKKFAQSLREINVWLRSVRNLLCIEDIWKIFRVKMKGHIQYYGVSENFRSALKFCFILKKLTMKWLNKRGQKKSFNVKMFSDYLKFHPLPETMICHNFYV